jgi:hypothetical protein
MEPKVHCRILNISQIAPNPEPADSNTYCDVHAVGQQSTVRGLFTAVAMQQNN